MATRLCPNRFDVPPSKPLPQRQWPAGCTTARLALAVGVACCLLLLVMLLVALSTGSLAPLPAPQLAALVAFKVSVAAGRATVGCHSSAIPTPMTNSMQFVYNHGKARRAKRDECLAFP